MTCAAFAGFVWKRSDNAATYRRYKSHDALISVFTLRLTNGMPVNNVIDLIGNPESECDERFVRMVRKVAPINRVSYPDGFQDADEFLSWKAVRDNGSEILDTLQFRDGRLVNYAREKWDATTGTKGLR